MNRIITILVTIFILLLLYIWISHVWGSDNPRRPKPIVDATEHNLMDDEGEPFDTTSTLSTNLLDDAPATDDGAAESIAENGNQATDNEDDESPSSNEFNTERRVTQKTPVTTTKQEVTKPAEPKKEEKQVTKPAPKTEAPPKTTNTTKTSESKPAAEKPAATQTKTTPAPPAKTVSAPASTDTGGKHLVIAGNFSQKSNADQRVNELKKAGFPEAEVVNFDLSEYHTVCAGRFADVNEARKLVKKLKDYHKIDAYVRIGS